MKRTPRIAGALLLVCLAFVGSRVDAGEQVINFKVPPSAYATSDNPPCAEKANLTAILQDPKVAAALSGGDPKTALVIMGAAKIAEHITKNHGGAISDIITRLNGGSRSSCQSACVVLPSGARLTQINLTGRNGDNESWLYKRTDTNPDTHAGPSITNGGPITVGSTGDWAGWDDLVVNSSGGWSVCATAKNWSHDQPSRQVMRVIYEP